MHQLHIVEILVLCYVHLHSYLGCMYHREIGECYKSALGVSNIVETFIACGIQHKIYRRWDVILGHLIPTKNASHTWTIGCD